jgi:RNA polymerase sigma factor (TIGR02999 family)
MRRILVDRARERRAEKRGGLMVRARLDPAELSGLLAADDADPEALLSLDQCLTALEQVHPRQARAVELRYFGALTLEEVGETLGTSAPTTLRDLRYALAWLGRALCTD